MQNSRNTRQNKGTRSLELHHTLNGALRIHRWLTYQLSSQTPLLQQGGQTCRWRSPCCSGWHCHKLGPTARNKGNKLGENSFHFGKSTCSLSLRMGQKWRDLQWHNFKTTGQIATNYGMYICGPQGMKIKHFCDIRWPFLWWQVMPTVPLDKHLGLGISNITGYCISM